MARMQQRWRRRRALPHRGRRRRVVPQLTAPRPAVAPPSPAPAIKVESRLINALRNLESGP